MNAVPQLPEFEQQLDRLRAVRHRRRLALLAMRAAVTCVVALGLLLLLDVAFRLTPLQRLAAVALVGLGGAAVLRPWCHDLVRERETRVAVAVRLEEQNQIQNDLVAGLQFAATPQACAQSSQSLTHAVIESARLWGEQREGRVTLASQPPIATWLLALLIAGAAVGVATTWPEHIRVFGRRMIFASADYPTDTVVEGLRVNGQDVLAGGQSDGPHTCRIAEGEAATFSVRATGFLPRVGSVELREQGGTWQPFTLRSRPDSQQVFAATSHPLLKSIEFRVRLGDAPEVRGTIEVVPRPVIRVLAQITQPDYVDAGSTSNPLPADRTIELLAGSDLQLSVECVNGKPLRSCQLQWASQGQSESIELAESANTGQWVTVEETRLQDIDAPFTFRVQAIDRDGLTPAISSSGAVRLTPDRPPAGGIRCAHRVYLSSASPTISYQFQDDYALASVTLRAAIQSRREPNNTAEDATGDAVRQIELPVATFQNGPWLKPQLPLAGDLKLDLKSLDLKKGDHVLVTARIVDFRGTKPGAAVETDPVIVEISDRAGVLAANAEYDRRVEESLNQLEKRQLGILESTGEPDE